MEEILRHPALDHERTNCPFCGDEYQMRTVCVICNGCVLCCWSNLHCLWCDLPEVLCGCEHCKADAS
jgi:hypothetical protein